VDVDDLDPDPIVQCKRWLDDAGRHPAVDEPAAVVLATADPAGRPSARAVLLRGLDERGFVFFTNTRSRKATELAANPHGALVFLWQPMHRQIRVTGTVERVDAATEDAYFAGRPRGSQLAAWASDQSEVVASRAALDARYEALEREHEGRDVPRPPHWGGYRLAHDEVELWSQRPNRMHDRLRYVRAPSEAGWRIERLAP
jgi:pyridoxamine 5'-phosphate oxidase